MWSDCPAFASEHCQAVNKLDSFNKLHSYPSIIDGLINLNEAFFVTITDDNKLITNYLMFESLRAYFENQSRKG